MQTLIPSLVSPVRCSYNNPHSKFRSCQFSPCRLYPLRRAPVFVTDLTARVRFHYPRWQPSPPHLLRVCHSICALETVDSDTARSCSSNARDQRKVHRREFNDTGFVLLPSTSARELWSLFLQLHRRRAARRARSSAFGCQSVSTHTWTHRECSPVYSLSL